MANCTQFGFLDYFREIRFFAHPFRHSRTPLRLEEEHEVARGAGREVGRAAGSISPISYEPADSCTQFGHLARQYSRGRE